jgi:hypothetical protein
MKLFEKLPVLPGWALMTMALVIATLGLLSLLELYTLPGKGFLFVAWMLLVFRAAQAEEERTGQHGASTP